jgi:hypothetical protein
MNHHPLPRLKILVRAAAWAILVVWTAATVASADDAAPAASAPAAVDASTPTVDASAPAAAPAPDAAAAPAAAPAPDAAAAAPAAPPAPTAVTGLKGLWSLNVGSGVSRPISSGQVAASGGAGPSLGVETTYGVTNQWALGGSYDYLNLRDAIRVQPLSLEIIRVVSPANRYSLIAKAGAGAAKLSGYPNSTGDFTKAAYKVGAGLRYAYDESLAFEAMATYHYVPIRGYGNDVHAMNFSIAAGYRFLPEKPATP